MKRHRFDPVSFIWGLFFTALGVLFATDAVEPTVAGLRSFWPLAGVALGLAILSSIRREPRPEPTATAPGPVPPAPAPSPFFKDNPAFKDDPTNPFPGEGTKPLADDDITKPLDQ
jgi:hypothetical protein